MRALIVILAVGALPLLNSCGMLTTKLAPRAASIVNAYCQEPQAERLLVREQVAAQIAPNRIEIHCQGDE